MSWIVAKLALPISRFSMMRPATVAVDAKRLELLVRLRAVARVQIGGERIAAKVVRKRVAPLAQRRELAATLGDDLVFVDGRSRVTAESCPWCRWRALTGGSSREDAP